MTEWISVKLRFPDHGNYDRKLVFSSCDGVCTARYNGEYFSLDPIGDYATGGFIPHVTHWAELPDPQDQI